MKTKAFIYFMGILLSIIATGCKLVHTDSLDEKIAKAVDLRKLPSEENRTALFSSPNWLMERSQRNSKRIRNLENFLPTIGIDQGNSLITDLHLNLDRKIGQQILSSSFHPTETSLDKLCIQKDLNGVIILHKGQIIYEQYPDMQPDERHVQYSISKSYAGTIIAILADHGLLNESDLLQKHISELKDKPLGQVSINDVLRMASGINCRELSEGSFSEPDHNFYKFLQYRGIYPEPEGGFEQSLMEFFAEVGIVAPAGQTNDYTTANTAVLSILAERVSGEPYHSLISKYIWSKIGAEDEARISLSNSGIAGSGGFVMSRLRDLARYGLAFTDDAPTKIASDRYLEKIRTGDRDLLMTDEYVINMFEGQGFSHNSYQWDIVFEDGDFAKFGFGGQGLYISPDKRLVIAFYSANKDESTDNMSLYYLSRKLALFDRFKKNNPI